MEDKCVPSQKGAKGSEGWHLVLSTQPRLIPREKARLLHAVLKPSHTPQEDLAIS